MKKRLVDMYIRLLRLMHKPLVVRGEFDPFHLVFREFLDLYSQSSSPAVLELGSRNVTGITRRHYFSGVGEYVGLDIVDGEGVDVVGDVHRLSDYLPVEKFDFAFSMSVFEHLLFPWKAVLELNKVIKPGGYFFMSTHPVWPAHELPWDFWRFPQCGLKALFNEHTGYEIVSLEEGLPARMYSLVDDLPTRNNCFETVNQGVALIAKKTSSYRADKLKWDVEIDSLLDSMYPKR